MQRTYAVGLGLMLFSYSVVLFALAFILPYLVPAIKLVSASPLEEQASAATRMLFQVEQVWPTLLAIAADLWLALLVLIVGAAVLSIYLTHRLAGPLYRFQRSASELAEGNLSLRIRLRKGDHLHDLADLTNQAISNIEQAMIEIRDRGVSSKEAIRMVLDEIHAQPAVVRAQLDKLEATVVQGQQHIEEVLKRFRLSESAR